VDELVVITGYHRKSILRALNGKPISADGDGSSAEPHQHHRCRYRPEVMKALVPLWEASDRLCGKRLQAVPPLLLESLERHGHLILELEVREKLLTRCKALAQFSLSADTGTALIALEPPAIDKPMLIALATRTPEPIRPAGHLQTSFTLLLGAVKPLKLRQGQAFGELDGTARLGRSGICAPVSAARTPCAKGPGRQSRRMHTNNSRNSKNTLHKSFKVLNVYRPTTNFVKMASFASLSIYNN
jgi:hypothetical protein